MKNEPTPALPLLTLLALLAGVLPLPATADDALLPEPIHQLRIYHIEADNRDAFHDRFRDHAARIMKKYGFHVIAMWESAFDGRTEFVYLLEWPDVATMRRQWDAFMADEEWARIKRETGRVHGTFVHDIEDRTLRLTRYSPATTLEAAVRDVAAVD
jgi:hypothetical protein